MKVMSEYARTTISPRKVPLVLNLCMAFSLVTRISLPVQATPSGLRRPCKPKVASMDVIAPVCLISLSLKLSTDHRRPLIHSIPVV